MKHAKRPSAAHRLVEVRDNRMLQNPAQVILISFVLLILTGTLLLMLPLSSRSGEVTPFINALFTATSASCVTGLTMYDTYSYFSLFGQAVILSLIQLGGLGLVTLTSFFYLAIGKKMGLRTAHLAQESVGSDERVDTPQLLKMVMGVTFTIELLGALVLLTVFVPEYGRYGIFMAFFFAVSAYCNAGFDLLGMVSPGSSLMTVQDNGVLLVTLMVLVITGGLGFIVWQDLFFFHKRRKLMLHTKVVLLFNGLLLLLGWVGFLLLEWNNPHTLGGLSLPDKLLNGLFQSVTCRTAGFDSIGQGELTGLGKLLSIALMFIGAAPGSTGGGIKLTTFIVLIMTAWSVIRDQDDTIIMNRRIDRLVVYRAFTVALLGLLAVCVTAGVLILTGSAATELDGIYEAVSAFATVGLSAGPTASATLLSKLALTLTMLTGRVGPVAFALSLSMRSAGRVRHRIQPEGRIWVG
ncbi:MAG: potassium transporter TrkG [Oscillospiraceae bacterium]|nr:potassium transporter TrkG [Oscillospiraceae bacterium]